VDAYVALGVNIGVGIFLIKLDLWDKLGEGGAQVSHNNHDVTLERKCFSSHKVFEFFIKKSPFTYLFIPPYEKLSTILGRYVNCSL